MVDDGRPWRNPVDTCMAREMGHGAADKIQRLVEPNVEELAKANETAKALDYCVIRV